VNPVISATLLLAASNVFMTFAWYAHLKLDYLWAAFCILGAVYFAFRSPGAP
jgi:uncharacterized protein (DUF486 family)